MILAINDLDDLATTIIYNIKSEETIVVVGPAFTYMRCVFRHVVDSAPPQGPHTVDMNDH